MAREDVDYHVGLLRGYMLALNAPTQILHALGVLLTDYKSKAGDLIGEADRTPVKSETPPKVDIRPISLSEKEDAPEATAGKKVFWTGGDDEVLERMYCREGKTAKHIQAALPHRSLAGINNRIFTKGLKRASI